MDLQLGRIEQISRAVSDVDKAIAFFQGKLGLRLVFRPHAHMAFIDCGGVNLFLEKANAPDAIRANSILYFRVNDLMIAVNELKSRGVEFAHGPHRIAQLETGDVFMAFFKDQDGNLLALDMGAPKGYQLPKSD